MSFAEDSPRNLQPAGISNPSARSKARTGFLPKLATYPTRNGDFALRNGDFALRKRVGLKVDFARKSE
jgi:hypothetical protein